MLWNRFWMFETNFECLKLIFNFENECCKIEIWMLKTNVKLLKTNVELLKTNVEFWKPMFSD